MVEHRHDLHRYDRVETIARMAEKIGAAAGKSSNYELIVTRRKLGGNGPIMANALACLGLQVTYVGCLGHPTIDPVFDEFAARAEVISIANPGFTNALEFADGKLMLSKLAAIHDVDWTTLIARIPVAELIRRFNECSLIGLLNWTELPGLTGIWEALIAEVFPHVPRTDRILFIDLVDPEKRMVADILGALATLTRFQEQVNVVLGLNLKEAAQAAGALGLNAPGNDLEATAAAIRSHLNLTAVVIHPREGAAAATSRGTASILGAVCGPPVDQHRRWRSLQLGLLPRPNAPPSARSMPRLRGGHQRLLCPDRDQPKPSRARRIPRRSPAARSMSRLPGPDADKQAITVRQRLVEEVKLVGRCGDDRLKLRDFVDRQFEPHLDLAIRVERVDQVCCRGRPLAEVALDRLVCRDPFPLDLDDFEAVIWQQLAKLRLNHRGDLGVHRGAPGFGHHAKDHHLSRRSLLPVGG